MKINKIGIIGLGLIGGSLCKSIKKNHICSNIVALDKNVTSLEKAKNEGIINSYCTRIDSTFENCNIIFLCLPVKSNLEYIKQLTPLVSSDCILTDVGSTKTDILTQVNELNLKCSFIGGHPMTGSEKSGYTSSKNHLFENAYYILCPSAHSTRNDVNLLKQLLENIGALVICLSYYEHDYIAASISHVPHIIASTLVNMIHNLDNSNKYMHLLAAGGFKDITRIASSSPIMWQNICLSNKNEILTILEKYINELNNFTALVKDSNKEEILNLFAESKNYRDSFSNKHLGPLIKTYNLSVDVEDKPGIIAEIATILSQNNVNIKNIGILNNREHVNGILEICFYDECSRNKGFNILKELNFTVYSF